VNKRTRAIALSIILFAGLTYLIAWSSVFSVKNIEVNGQPAEVSAASIITKTHITIGEKLARIEPRSIEKNLSELSWVKSVSVKRNWIRGTVVIAMAPRIPLGLYEGKAIDSTGTLFDLPGNTPSGLPTVSAASPALGLQAISLFTALPTDLRDSLISISAANESSISSWQLETGRKVKVSWGAVSQIELKVSVYRALLALPENKNISSIDLSAPHAPIVK